MEEVPIRCWSARLGPLETEVTIEVLATADSNTGLGESGNGNMEMEVKLNGVLLKELEPPASESVADEAGPTLNGAADKLKSGLSNGASGKSDASSDESMAGSSESEEEEEEEEEIAVRTRSRTDRGKAKSPPKVKQKRQKNGKVAKSEGKKTEEADGEEEKVLAPVARRWDIPLVLGPNIIDVKVGGPTGEAWRVFLERIA